MRSELLLELREAGITSIECDYSGYGDDGQINGINFEGDELSSDLRDRLEDFFWDVTQDHYEGFHNNDGGCGSITWEIGDDDMTLAHQYAMMVYTEEEPITVEREEEEIGA